MSNAAHGGCGPSAAADAGIARPSPNTAGAASKVIRIEGSFYSAAPTIASATDTTVGSAR
ncbi:hypothetical protein [[Mycobacterium] nativiensis]|uniref:Uncharacterized protein n=1 Tax=[Mycobacterium] nativiensis TaxID=2855503 RepID=A0ABU5XVP0_9MYCO|nr:hypothetical protein [Mycolicibacter sp. MYC340]MEB3032057.1 hypothetical protein [Mycolicibacter sp. MYC340]